ncbi:hypothetical protein H6P81_007433 [Aristolochia fimbriata]|uniref:Cytochrome P450 n=1 Tax=Aristolochia fimbriata TaxID=158543 RepID=A0AAV7F0U6_ARIFI|nr:hypothetical protein H6P81_007433 [Aristolochia fimbriata]
MDVRNKFRGAAQAAWSWVGEITSGGNLHDWVGDEQSIRTSNFWPFLVAAAAGIAVLWAVLMIISKGSGSKRRVPPLPPGPRGLPLLGCLPYLEPDIHSWFARLSRQYGPIISLKLGQKLFVVVSSPSLAKELLKDQDTTFANRDVPPASLALLSGVHGMGWAPYGAQWRMLRRVCMGEMLNTSKLDLSFHVRRRAVQGMVAEVHGAAGTPIDVGKVMFGVMYEVITGLLWGASVAGEEKTRVGEEFRKVVEYLTSIFCKPDVSDFYPILAPFDLGGVFRDTQKGGVKLDRILDSLFDQSQLNGGDAPQGNRDLLQILVQIQKSGDPKTPLTRDHIKSLLMDLILAGNDTTWTTMEWAMTEAVRNPEMTRRAQEEVDRVVGKSKAVEETHLWDLHYVNAFVKEVLRLHPVVPLMLPRTPSESTPLGGYTVPKGCRLLVNMWALQRDPAAWESPEEFRPERFLTAAGRKREFTGNDFHYFPFGSGRRICPGMALAERMLMYVIASLLHSFDWTLPQGREVDVSEKFGIVLKKAKPLVAVPTPRLSHPDCNHNITLGLLLLITAVTAILAWLVHVAKKTSKSSRRVSLPPGPRGVPFLGFLPFLEPDIHGWFARLACKYGPIISLNLGQKRFIVVSSPSLAKEILRDHDATFANRDVPPGSLALLNGVHGMGWAPYGPQWRMLRRVCMGEMLNSSKLDISFHARRRAVREMVAELHGAAGAPVNFEKVMFSMMYKAITGMLWEATLSEEEKLRVRTEFEKAIEYLAAVFCKPDLSDFFPVLAPFDFGGVVRDTKKGGVVLEHILDSLIDQRLKKGNDDDINIGTRDFLHVLLQVQSKGDPKTPLTRSHVKEAMKHPEVMKRAQEELDGVVGKDNAVEETHLRDLHYLNAVVKEVLRLHPVIPLMLPRTPSQSTPVGGYIVPKGSRVLVNVWAIQRDPDAWESPEEFQPERFLIMRRADDQGKLEFNGNDLRYFPFGSGRRICPGMALAEKMLMYTMATLLHSFDWKLPQGTNLDVSEKFGFVLKKAEPLLAPISSHLDSVVSTIMEGYARWWAEDERSSMGETARKEDYSSPALIMAFLLVIWLIFLVANKWYSKKPKLRLPPGPPGLPIVGNLPFLDRNLQFHHHLAELARTYGPIFRLRLGQKLCIVISSPSLAKEMLKDHDAVFANHDVPPSALVLPNGLHGMAWAPQGHQWRLLRKLAVGEMLCNTRLEAFQDVRRREVRRMVRRVYNKSGEPVAIREMLFTTLFDVLTGMLWGNTVLKDDDRDDEGELLMQEIGEEFRRVVTQILGSFGQLSVSDLFPFLAPFDLQGLERRRKEIAARLHQILDSIIDHMIKKDSESSDHRDTPESKEFLRVLLRMEKRGDPTVPLTRDQIKGLIVDLVMAGMDTTAVTSEWVMSELMNHREIMEKVQEELDRVVGRECPVEETHLSRLSYLNAVIKEAMRLHPAAPLMLPRTPSETCTLGGYAVPKGTRVMVNMWAIMRDPTVWENPTQFRPERFLNPGGGGTKRPDFFMSGNDFHFFPFGSGRRICPGAPFADRMLMYGLATLLHSFEWRLPQGAEVVDLKEKFGMVLKKSEPLSNIIEAAALRQVFVAVLVVAWFGVFVRKWRKGKLMRLPPGPRGLPLVGNLPFLDGNNLHHHLADLAFTYGNIFSLRLGRKLCIVVSSPSLAKELLKDKDATFANHDVPSSALVLPNGLHGMAWAPHGAQWRMLRKLAVGEMLNNTRLEAFREVRREEIRQMVRRIYNQNVQSAGDHPRPVAIREMLFSTLFDVLTGMLWGSETLKADPAMTEMGEEFRRVVQQILGSFGRLGVSDFFPFLAPFDLQGLERKRKKIADRLHRILDAIIDHKRRVITKADEKSSTINTCTEFLMVLLKMEEKVVVRGSSELGCVREMLLAAVALLWWWFVIVNKYWRKEKAVRLPPGPRGWPLVGNLPSLKGAGNLHERLLELSHTYGPVLSLRLGRKLCVVVSSAASARELLKDQDAIFANRDVPAASRVLPNGSDGIVFGSLGPTWGNIRRITVGEMLNHARLEAYGNLRREEMGKMVRFVQEKARAVNPVEIQRLMYDALYNVVAGMLWGDTLKAEGMNGVAAEFVQTVDEVRGSFRGLGIGDLFPFLAPLDLQGEVRRRKKLSEKLHRILDSIIDARLKMAGSGEEGRNDFLRLLIARTDGGTDAAMTMPLSTANFKALILDLILAGIDTTAYAMEWAMAELMQNPEIMKKAREELDRVVGSEKEVEESHLPRLTYLHAVLKETLRLRPVVPLMLPRTPSQPSTLTGYSIPMGSRILVNMWAIQKDPQAWENPLEFRPERFLAGDRKWDFSGNDFHFFPFGSGRRICPGAALADRILMSALASLLHLFDWKLPPGTTLDLSETFALALKKAEPLLIIPSPRFSNLGL